MTVFLSYAHQDADVVDALRQNLDDMGHSVWLDQTLYGGQIWWDEILRQVRDCHVFMLAVSRHSLVSEACLAEAEYATAMHRPFLPVRIDDTEMTTAPKLLRDTQHIDYTRNDAASVIALAKALNSIPDSVPLPDVLPPAPPTPQSYRDRYAALLGAEPLSLDEQMNYFVRLSVDIDTANSDEAVELLRALHEREDLSWKVRERIDRFLAEHREGVTHQSGAETDADDGNGADDRPSPAGDGDTGAADAGSSSGRSRRRWWIVGAAAAVVAIVIVLIVVLTSDDKPAAAQLPENDTCDTDSCGSTPIRFFVSGDPEQITVTLTDPYDDEVSRVDQPTPRLDGKGLEWTWNAQYYDPIGTYSVSFAVQGASPIEHTFTITARDSAFGVVQKAAEALSNQDWEAAAAIDRRIADEYDNGNGRAVLESEYPPSDEKHWLPYDASGTSNDASTTIVGAYIAYTDSPASTTASCEIWAVDLNGDTMRSDAIRDADGQQVTLTISGRHPPSDFEGFVHDGCYAAAHPS